ncbi:hypothetical protein [Pseudomonas sichuanensis]|nr:hypothetical protein [Pseudomonas sichuanensis]
MGKILIDYGVRGKREIDVPDSVAEIDISPRIRELGEWLGEAIQGMNSRQEHVDALRRAGWQRTADTERHFNALASDVEHYKGSAINTESDDFYDWIKDPDVSKHLPADTRKVIKSPAARISEMVAKLTNSDPIEAAKSLIKKFALSDPNLSPGEDSSKDVGDPSGSDHERLKKLLESRSPDKINGPTLLIGTDAAKPKPKSSSSDESQRNDNESDEPDDLTY